MYSLKLIIAIYLLNCACGMRSCIVDYLTGTDVSTTGTPQGSVLSPIFFLFSHISDTTGCNSSNDVTMSVQNFVARVSKTTAA